MFIHKGMWKQFVLVCAWTIFDEQHCICPVLPVQHLCLQVARYVQWVQVLLLTWFYQTWQPFLLRQDIRGLHTPTALCCCWSINSSSVYFICYCSFSGAPSHLAYSVGSVGCPAIANQSVLNEWNSKLKVTGNHSVLLLFCCCCCIFYFQFLNFIFKTHVNRKQQQQQNKTKKAKASCQTYIGI